MSERIPRRPAPGSKADAPLADVFREHPLLGALAESPLQGLALLRIEPFRIEYCNEALAAIVGMSPGEFRAMDQAAILALTLPEDRVLLGERVALRRAGGEVPDRFRLRIRRPDGAVRFIEGVVRPITLAGQRAALGAAVDITEHVEANEATRASETRYRLLFEEMNDAAFLADAATGVLLDVNKRAEELMNRSRRELIGLHQHFLHPPGEEERYRENFCEHVAHGHARDFDGEIVRPDGSRVPVAISAAIFDIGGRRCNLGLFRDLTVPRREEAERLRFQERMLQAQKLESLGLLAGGIAHDFNNLLQAILGNADLLRLEPAAAAPSTAELVDHLLVAARRAGDLVRQLLNYTGRGQSSPRDVDLNALARDMGELLRVSVPKKVALEFELADGLPTICADPTQVRQLLMNLIVNGAESIGDRVGTVHLATGACLCDRELLASADWTGDMPEGPGVFLEVRDDGAGMDEETRARIFDPFFTTKAMGRGLGLPVVLGVVRAHHGALTVRSRVGAGSAVRVYFPCGRQDAAACVAAAGSGPVYRRSGTVLVVDDDEPARMVLRRMLARIGFEVEEAEDGERAVELFRERGSALAAVVLDLTMPRMGGEQALPELRRMRPGIPVLMISGYEEPAMAGPERPDAFLHKPFSFDELVAQLQCILPGERSSS
jgi:two-component system cell cycle sensor histidine kinase/response regulator CckA